MNRSLRFPVFCALAACMLLLVTGCSDKIGYSVLLWSVPEKNVYDGDTVPVYIKSNISKVYVVGVPGSQEKIEVPLWQILPPDSERKIRDTYEPMSEYTGIYAQVQLDGLPIRFEPVNTSRQVYRLKKNEVIKVLYKGNGAQVMSGSRPMPGDWLRVLTSDGTQGWCFSFNLQLYDERGPQVVRVEEPEQIDLKQEVLLKNVWYPEQFQTLINANRIDLSVIKSEILFDPGEKTGQIVFNSGDVSVTYPYTGVTKTGDSVYNLNGTPLSATVRRNDFIVVQYLDKSGQPKSYNLVTLQTPPDELIAAEKERRAVQIARVADYSNEYRSNNYGVLHFEQDGSFTWNGYQMLIPSVIPQGTTGRGKVEIRYFIDTVLSTWYDGVLTFTFAGSTQPVHFLYKLEDNGLRLEDVGRNAVRNNVVTTRSPSALVLFFGT